MKKQTFSRSMACGLMVIAFFLLPINRVYASTTPTYNDNTYWNWWYVEQTTGVSAEDIQTTDAGIPTGEYIANNGGGTRQDAYNWIKDKYDNATNATAKGIDYYYNAVDDIYNKSVDYAVKGYYAAENAVRKTVDTAGKTIYDVSSSDFWSGFYNQMYNGGGYKDQYTQNSTGGYNVDVNGKNFTLRYVGFCFSTDLITIDHSDYVKLSQYVSVYESYCFSTSTPLGNQYTGTKGIRAIIEFSADDVICYIATPNIQTTYDGYVYISENVDLSAYYYQYRYRSPAGTSESTLRIPFVTTASSTQPNTTPVLQPSQMGFIINPLTGYRIPVYTDPTQNPFTINPNGTVTMDGNDYPIYVDPEDISDDGWLWLLRYLQNQNQTDPTQNPWGLPWNTQPDGTTQGGFFSNLVKDISSMFSGIADKLGKLFQGLLDGILKALKGLFDIDFSQLNSVEFDVDFNVIEDVINKLLQMLGVPSCFLI